MSDTVNAVEPTRTPEGATTEGDDRVTVEVPLDQAGRTTQPACHHYSKL